MLLEFTKCIYYIISALISSKLLALYNFFVVWAKLYNLQRPVYPNFIRGRVLSRWGWKCRKIEFELLTADEALGNCVDYYSNELISTETINTEDSDNDTDCIADESDFKNSSDQKIRLAEMFWRLSFFMYPVWCVGVRLRKYATFTSPFQMLCEEFPDFEWSIAKDSLFRRHPLFRLAFDKTNNYIVLALRGSVTLKDWYINLDSTSIVVNNSRFHSGMYKSAQHVYELVAKPIEDIVLKKNLSNPVIHCCGHSLGGGVASLIAIKLKQKYENVYAWSYGAPCITDINTAYSTRSYINSFILGNDFVPRFSMQAVAVLIICLKEISRFRWTDSAPLDGSMLQLCSRINDDLLSYQSTFLLQHAHLDPDFNLEKAENSLQINRSSEFIENTELCSLGKFPSSSELEQATQTDVSSLESSNCLTSEPDPSFNKPVLSIEYQVLEPFSDPKSIEKFRPLPDNYVFNFRKTTFQNIKDNNAGYLTTKEYVDFLISLKNFYGSFVGRSHDIVKQIELLIKKCKKAKSAEDAFEICISTPVEKALDLYDSIIGILSRKQEVYSKYDLFPAGRVIHIIPKEDVPFDYSSRNKVKDDFFIDVTDHISCYKQVNFDLRSLIHHSVYTYDDVFS